MNNKCILAVLFMCPYLVELQSQHLVHSFSISLQSQLTTSTNNSSRFGYKVVFNYCVSTLNNQYKEGILKSFKILPGTNISLIAFSNMIGSEVLNENENPLRNERFNLDFAISPILSFGWGLNENEIVRFAYLNSENEMPLINPFSNSINFTSSFIINSKGRNQQTGGIGFKFNRFYFDYFNDGSFFIGDNGLGDDYDRYWTGGARIGVIIKNPNPKGVIDTFLNIYSNYRVYTGFSKNAYELSHDLLLKYATGKNPFQYLLNSGELKFGLQLNRNTQIECGFQSRSLLLGQNQIHRLGRMPYHFGLTHNRILLNYKYTMNGDIN
ncbi:MAG: hypothetical protein IPP06_05475 [Saprospiraceae bacterium]|nr:hypothetical protein [Candidatus Vicinibacter affinis]